jgi:hypothetical protein
MASKTGFNICGTRVLPISIASFDKLKVLLRKMRFSAGRTGTRRAQAIASYLVIGFFAGVSATYVFEHGFHAPVSALLGIAGILAGIAIGAGFNWGKLRRAHRKHTNNNRPQTKPRWDYRPRHVVQRYAAPDSGGTETLDDLSRIGSAATVDHDTWFNFGSVGSAAEDVPTNTLPPKQYD